MFNLLAGAIIGAVFSFAGGYILTRIVEYNRLPALEFSVGSVYDMPPELVAGLIEPARFLRVCVTNKKMPERFQWLERRAAENAIAEVSFHRCDGTMISQRWMKGRWSGSDQPIPMVILNDHGKSGKIFDWNLMLRESSKTIYPERPELLDIAIRCPSDRYCFGWSNESYQAFKNPRWQLGFGTYIVRIKILTSGKSYVSCFRLHNAASFDCFRLEIASSEEELLVSLKSPDAG